MYTRELRKIRQFLDSIPVAEEDITNPQHCFDLVEEAAISTLDNQFMDFPLEAEAEPGLLFCYLEIYLRLRRLEYGLEYGPDPFTPP